ncbi:bifunctional helix-turn-helix transcriptional regulator/GNAT family N-acetyltransferase [Cognatishimia activa]|uniref:bifunctional helix-turn-helix transcriptional regulator/GNAT family N-acetyltransferase n=1 Tax=Cognatishimia activa TaxID=1715691 RepID=UPI0022310F22|nr:helix-turn-helix domain-containing GNAT family N-acetyltransferase [Cognatishimia activa]UZD90018.1 bifunctional helix-turn-helix transcriptional regulator/GNAT family N-acetyltransferase [Cognatishimia activa]
MKDQDIQRIRRFNRAVTAKLGVLDSSFMGRGRPLGVARVIHAIGHFGSDIGVIRTQLGLDKAVLSRMLRGLESDGLITFRVDTKDARKRHADLTDKGQAEYNAYDTLSNDHAADLLANHPQTEQVLKAMDLIATAFTRDHVAITPMDPRACQSISCLENYYTELETRFERGFDVSLSRDPEAINMMTPLGAFYVAMSDGVPLGCCGLKGVGTEVAEIKRLWVSPAARGMGLAQRLLTECEVAARELGIKVLRLDTNSALPEAEKLYRKTGWTQIDRFNDDPYPDLFFEKAL